MKSLPGKLPMFPEMLSPVIKFAERVNQLRNLVVIKSSKYGMIVRLDPEAPYQELLTEIKEKFTEGAHFFNGSTVAITFEGRVLTKAQEREVIDIISTSADIHITCIVDNNQQTDKIYREIVSESMEELDRRRDGRFYRGTLKKKQVLETESSIIIIGDVEAGAVVISKGNVIVLGTIRGTVHAGAAGRRDAFISALAIRSKRLKIGEKGLPQYVVAEYEDLMTPSPKIAKLDGTRIYIDPLVN
ncbi:MAG: septum site-determining protein MinC [Lachnospiraceae bacterium]